MSADAKLCPREPTREMLQAVLDCKTRWWDIGGGIGTIWRLMYDAAPATAAGGDLDPLIFDLNYSCTLRLAAALQAIDRLRTAIAAAPAPHSPQGIVS